MAPDADAGRAPRSDPFAPLTSDHLPVGDGHEIYVETVGRSDGIAAVYLHGGPGSGCQPDHRRLFDPERFHTVLFDQRGCGRSRPKGSRDAQYPAAPDRRHGADPRKIRVRPLDGGRRLLGRDPGARLCAGTSRPRLRPGAARDLSRYQGRSRDCVYRDAAALLSRPLRGFPQLCCRPRSGRSPSTPIGGAFSIPIRLCTARPRGPGTRPSGYCPSMHPRAAGSTWPRCSHRVPCRRRPSWKRITSSTTASCGRTSYSTRPENSSAFPASSSRAVTICLCPPATSYALGAVWSDAEIRVIEGAGHMLYDPGIRDAVMKAIADMASRQKD